METTAPDSNGDTIKPPVTEVGAIGWVKANLFDGVFNSVLTIAVLYLLWVSIPPLFQWAFVDSLWVSSGQECQQADGACWSIIPANIRFILFGFYPYEQPWPPTAAIAVW